MDYQDYLALDRLLDCQRPVTGVHEEMLFICAHQTYEIWFKLVVCELDALVAALREGAAGRATLIARRVGAILRAVLQQAAVLDTLTPDRFLAFRDGLGTASGLQSSQFREIELLLGVRHAGYVKLFSQRPELAERLSARMSGDTVWDGFLAWLAGRGLAIPPDQLERDRTQPIASSPGVRRVLVDLYESRRDEVVVCELLVDLDQLVQELRYRHLKLVERTMGFRRGTAGSSGVNYLHSRLVPVFVDLWAIRTYVGAGSEGG
jgi:tryptophan 2,3-dioxygenase